MLILCILSNICIFCTCSHHFIAICILITICSYLILSFFVMIKITISEFYFIILNT